MERSYIVLAEDEEARQTLVFHVLATTPTHARTLITRFYEKQGWNQERLTQTVVSVRKKLMIVGHVLQPTNKDLESLCTTLLERADTCEQESEKALLYDLVERYDLGARLIERRREQ